jgi:hypothetical protein
VSRYDVFTDSSVGHYPIHPIFARYNRYLPDELDIQPDTEAILLFLHHTKAIKAISHIRKVLETSKIEIEYMNRRMHAFWVAPPTQIRFQMARQWVNQHHAT